VYLYTKFLSMETQLNFILSNNNIETKCTNSFRFYEIGCIKIEQKITRQLETLQQWFKIFITNNYST